MNFDAELDRVHAACDAAFGVRARFVPASGAAIEGLTVEKHAPAPEFGLGEAKAVIPDTLLRVTRAALGVLKPKKGDTFELLDAAGKVTERLRLLAGATIEDDDAKRWTCKVELNK